MVWSTLTVLPKALPAIVLVVVVVREDARVGRYVPCHLAAQDDRE